MFVTLNFLKYLLIFCKKMTDSTDEDISSDENISEWVPYSERNEWKDVVPLSQDDGPDPIVAIAYTDRCKFNFNKFNIILE